MDLHSAFFSLFVVFLWEKQPFVSSDEGEVGGHHVCLTPSTGLVQELNKSIGLGCVVGDELWTASSGVLDG